MKTFYIPSSSLNFNNIFSSESISPRAFYGKRSYGYSRWVSIPENPLENSILLYERKKSFTRPTSDMEDHPMLVEIAIPDEIANEFKMVAETVFAYDKTLYIDPFSTRIIFFSENDMKIAYSLSDSSNETKMLHIYRNRIDFEIPSPECYDPNIIKGEYQELNVGAIESERKINKIKGILYGYYIGYILSSNKKNLSLLSAYREIQNIFSAIISSIDKKATPLQTEKLNNLFDTINEETELYSQIYSYLKNKVQTDVIYSIIRQTQGMIRGEERLSVRLNALYSDNQNPDTPNSSLEWVNKQIERVIQKQNAERRLIDPSQDRIVASGTFINKIEIENLPELEKKIIIHWLNGILLTDKYNYKISPASSKIATDLTIAAKEILASEWESSMAKIELNNIRRYVDGQEYPHTWGVDIFSALAAVLTKGDNWSDLLKFLQTKQIEDCRLAFILWGALYGFANMPRDFVDHLIYLNSGYVARVYREFYGQLFSRKTESLNVSKLPTEKKVNNEVSNKSILEDSVAEQSGCEIEEDMPDFENEDNSNELAAFNEEFSVIVDKAKSAEKDRDKYYSAWKQFGGFNESCIEYLLQDTSFYNGKGIQNNVKKHLTGLLKKNSKKGKKVPNQQAKEMELNLWSATNSSGNFLDDFDFLVNNKDFVASVSYIPDWKKDLKWFIKEHKYPSKKSYYAGKPTDNESVIRRFVDLHQKKYAAAEKILKEIYKK